MMLGAVLRGRSYSEIVSGPRGAVEELIPLLPDQVIEEVIPSGRLKGQLRVRYWEPDGQDRVLLPDQLFRLQGPFGMSVVQAARQGIGLALATEGFGARLFGQALTHRGMLEHSATHLLTIKTAKNDTAPMF